MLKTGLIFGNGMVLQREKKIPIWGFAEPFTEVHVTIQGVSSGTVSDDSGAWNLTLPPLRTSFEEIMEIRSGMESLSYSGVQVGEVWLAGGQSNMEFHMRYDADYADERKRCENPCIRFFDYPEVSYVGQLDEADYSLHYGFWRKSEPEQLERFSAVGYYFAKELQAKYHVPVGVIGCNWGGTPACAWMSEKAIRDGGGQIYLDEYAAAIKNLDPNSYDQMFRRNPHRGGSGQRTGVPAHYGM